jgi:hypothetical protein
MLCQKRILWGLTVSVMFSCLAIAADEKSAGAPVASQEMRAKMATLHEQMATCLRSEKPLSECRSEMMKGCQERLGDRGCPMMGMSMNHSMMKAPAVGTAKDK